MSNNDSNIEPSTWEYNNVIHHRHHNIVTTTPREEEQRVTVDDENKPIQSSSFANSTRNRCSMNEESPLLLSSRKSTSTNHEQNHDQRQFDFFHKHLSMEGIENSSDNDDTTRSNRYYRWCRYIRSTSIQTYVSKRNDEWIHKSFTRYAIIIICISMCFISLGTWILSTKQFNYTQQSSSNNNDWNLSNNNNTNYNNYKPMIEDHIISIENAIEKYIIVDVVNNISIWYRVWGNINHGIPLLFVHGGPGNAVSDYHNGNKRFFNTNIFCIYEVDQRGTGLSYPSIRTNITNMKYYYNISISMICEDYELIRIYENITKWLVWGKFLHSIVFYFCFT